MSAKENSNQYKALGTRLKFLREQWQQTIQDVCESLEIDEKTLRSFESGKRLPTPEVLDMLISHFLLTEDQAQDLRELAEDQHAAAQDSTNVSPEDLLAKQLVMFMPIDSRVVYTDSMQATVTDNGVMLQFMQQASNGQSTPVSRVGMSREHAEKVIEVLQNTLRHHDRHDDSQRGNKKQVSSSDS